MDRNTISSPGKMRGLQVTSNAQAHFTILAIDHPASIMKASIRPANPASVTYKEIVAVKNRFIHHLAPYVSAVLVDPMYGLGPAVLGGALPGTIGLLMPIEDGDDASPERPAQNFEGWSVAHIKQAGGAAVKVFFYYHPDHTELAQAQEAYVAGLVEECHHHDLPLFAEPISYGVSGDEHRRVVIESARRFARLGIDILKAEFPVDIQAQPAEEIWEDACRELSKAIGIPWVLLSAGVDFNTFTRQLSAACKGGASGYLAGRAIWKDAMILPPEAQDGFIQERVVARLQALNDIVYEFARPWTDFYPAQSPPQGWYKAIKTSATAG